MGIVSSKDFVVAISRFKVVEVLRKNSSTIFKHFQAGDIIVARLYLNNTWKISRIPANDELGKEILLGNTVEGNFFNFIDPNHYNQAFELESVEMSECEYKERVKNYCKDLCLMSGDEQTCACCPLKL